MTKEHKNRATPFVKWAGGKRNLITELKNTLPDNFIEYFEPFVGGGALFFSLHHELSGAHLSDSNPDLINAYNIIKDKPVQLIEQLRVHDKHHCDDYYYEIRAQHELQCPVEMAARFMYLNKTCFNGLYRVNKSGRFNVPIGKYKNPNIIQEDNIMACSEVLQDVDIILEDFTAICPLENDLVYFDPPYHKVVDESFTSYTKSDFTHHDQIRLRDFAWDLSKSGVKVIISNSSTDFIKSIYSSDTFNIKTVTAPRSINSKAHKRGAVEELIITNF